MVEMALGTVWFWDNQTYWECGRPSLEHHIVDRSREWVSRILFVFFMDEASYVHFPWGVTAGTHVFFSQNLSAALGLPISNFCDVTKIPPQTRRYFFFFIWSG